jgi:hypothetical protein
MHILCEFQISKSSLLYLEREDNPQEEGRITRKWWSAADSGVVIDLEEAGGVVGEGGKDSGFSCSF